MRSSPPRSHLLTLLFLAGTVPSPLHGQYVRVTGASVNIRDMPALEGTVVANAEHGDVFSTTGETEGWYPITMFSGETRFLHASLAVPVEQLPTLQVSENVRRLAFEGFLRADDRSFIEAAEKAPPSDELANTRLRKILEDRYKLLACHGFPTIHPVHFDTIQREGREKGWDRIGANLPRN